VLLASVNEPLQMVSRKYRVYLHALASGGAHRQALLRDRDQDYGYVVALRVLLL
jgi:hypothetical protein